MLMIRIKLLISSFTHIERGTYHFDPKVKFLSDHQLVYG